MLYAISRFNRRSVLAAALVAVLGAVPAAASAATASSDSTATIVTAISLTNTAALDFGSAVADAASQGTVEMGAGGTRTCTTVTCVTQDPGNAASFDVSGEANYSYDVTLPGSAITLTHDSNGTDTMSADTFAASNAGSGTLDGSGADTFTVGATLTVGAGQTAGGYTGTFDVSVDYQ